MNPTKQRNPGRRAARAFAAMALAATSFLVPAAAQAADEATTGPDAATDATAADASATTAEADASTEDSAPASSEALSGSITSCDAMRTAPRGPPRPSTTATPTSST